MKYGRSLQELAIELDRQAKVKKDYVATAGAMQMTAVNENFDLVIGNTPFQLCLLYTSPSPRDRTRSRMPSSA